MTQHLGIRNPDPLIKCFQAPNRAAYSSGKESLLEGHIIEQWESGHLRASDSNLIGVHIATSFTDPPTTVEHLWSLTQFNFPLVCIMPSVKTLVAPLLEGLVALCNMLGCMQVCSTRFGCQMVSFLYFLDWKAEDSDFDLEKRWKYLEPSANILLLYLPLAGFLLKLKVQSRTQAETMFLFRERFISPYLSQPKHRYLILRQLSQFPL